VRVRVRQKGRQPTNRPRPTFSAVRLQTALWPSLSGFVEPLALSQMTLYDPVVAKRPRPAGRQVSQETGPPPRPSFGFPICQKETPPGSAIGLPPAMVNPLLVFWPRASPRTAALPHAPPASTGHPTFGFIQGFPSPTSVMSPRLFRRSGMPPVSNAWRVHGSLASRSAGSFSDGYDRPGASPP